MSRDIAPEADTKYFNEQRATRTASIKFLCDGHSNGEGWILTEIEEAHARGREEREKKSREIRAPVA